jgi:hypothetical protein
MFLLRLYFLADLVLQYPVKFAETPFVFLSLFRCLSFTLPRSYYQISELLLAVMLCIHISVSVIISLPKFALMLLLVLW